MLAAIIFTMENKEFKKLKKDNEKLRKEIKSFTPKLNEDYLFGLINRLIENELQQEEMCNN